MSDNFSKPIVTIPNQWTGAPLKRWVKTKITDGPHETPEFLPDGVPFASAESVWDGRIHFESRRGNISREQHEVYSQKLLPQRDDIFMVKSGATTGKLAYVDTDIEFNVWSPLALIRADTSKILPEFLFHAMNSNYVQDQVRTTWSAGTQPNISMGAIEDLFIIAPSIPQQHAIADYLDRETARIDTLIATKERLLELLAEKPLAIITHAVTRGVNAEVSLRNSGEEGLEEIPSHWGSPAD